MTTRADKKSKYLDVVTEFGNITVFRRICGNPWIAEYTVFAMPSLKAIKISDPKQEERTLQLLGQVFSAAVRESASKVGAMVCTHVVKDNLGMRLYIWNRTKELAVGDEVTEGKVFAESGDFRLLHCDSYGLEQWAGETTLCGFVAAETAFDVRAQARINALWIDVLHIASV